MKEYILNWLDGVLFEYAVTPKKLMLGLIAFALIFFAGRLTG